MDTQKYKQECCCICEKSCPHLHAALESAEIIDLSSKHQVGKLSISQENDEEHDGKTHEVLGTAGHGGGQLTHCLVEVDELKKLWEWRSINHVFT